MPVYDYRCDTCTTEFEARRRVEERDQTACPRCGGLKVTRAMPLTVTYVKAPVRASAPPEWCCGGEGAEGCCCAGG